jgi:hypothetical protein
MRGERLGDGAILMTTDIEQFRADAERLSDGEGRSAVLDPCEPELRVSIEGPDPLGHPLLRVELTPEPPAQSHAMEFEIDLSYLPGLTAQCSRILEEFPVRGRNNG